jgi:hypothetical protein
MLTVGLFTYVPYDGSISLLSFAVERASSVETNMMLAGRPSHVLPLGARFGAGGAGGWVNLHPPHRVRLSGIASSSGSRDGEPSGPLRGVSYPLRTGELHRTGHVDGGLGEHDGNRPLVDEEVPRVARVVAAALARDVKPPLRWRPAARRWRRRKGSLALSLLSPSEWS